MPRPSDQSIRAQPGITAWRVTTLIGIALWAIFWGGLSLILAFGEAPEGFANFFAHLATAAIFIVAALAAVFWARVGGVLLVGVGVASFLFFHSEMTTYALALPACVLGVSRVLTGVYSSNQRGGSDQGSVAGVTD